MRATGAEAVGVVANFEVQLAKAVKTGDRSETHRQERLEADDDCR